MTRKLILIATAVMTTLMALLVLWTFREVVAYVLISLALAATLRPLVIRLIGKSKLVRAGWLLAYLLALACFVFFLFLVGNFAFAELQTLAQSISVQNTWVLPIWLQGTTFQQTLVTRLPPPNLLFEAVTGDKGQLVLPALLAFVQDIGNLTAGLSVILFLSIYWIINQVHFERLWLSLLPSGGRKQARGIWRTIEPDIGAYIRSQLTQSLLTGLLLCIGYYALGSPYPVLLALICALACLIPVVGSALAVIPPLLVGLMTSVQLSLFSVLFTLGILIGMIIWVKPRLFNRKWDNPILTVVLLLVLAEAFGIIGIILAPPLSVVCQILWSRLVTRRAVVGPATRISDLKERQARVLEKIMAMEEAPPPLVTSSMERLTLLIAEAEPILPADMESEPPDLLVSASPLARQ